jgi:hypothetical protein
MKAASTADTRPRSRSGVASAAVVERTQPFAARWDASQSAIIDLDSNG